MGKMRMLPVILALATVANAVPLSFNRDIRPILSNNCYQCHGPDSAARKANLRLDREANSRAELKSGSSAIVPGNLEDSELIYRITTSDVDEKMPPADSHRKLTPQQIEKASQRTSRADVFDEENTHVRTGQYPPGGCTDTRTTP